VSESQILTCINPRCFIFARYTRTLFVSCTALIDHFRHSLTVIILVMYPISWPADEIRGKSALKWTGNSVDQRVVLNDGTARTRSQR